MIMTVAELRQFIETDEADQALEVRLQALEHSIRAYTNNNFQIRALRAVASAMSEGQQLITAAHNPFKPGDTLQITDSELNAGLFTVKAVEDGIITVNEELYDEAGVVITKVWYTADVKLGVANMLKWQLDNGDKIGVASETLSRHSVTYFNMDGDNSTMGFPKALLGFLKPYMKARFGQGMRA